MTTVEATCPDCGKVKFPVDNLELGVCSYRPASYYVFKCPSCNSWVFKKADIRVIDLLVAEGVYPFHFDLPAEILERPANAALLTEDDVLDMMLDLDDPACVEHLRAELVRDQ